MVTLITEQLCKQSLEEPYHKAFTFNASVSLPAVGSSPTISWNSGKTTQEASSDTHQSCKAYVLADSCDPWPRSCSGEPLQGLEVSLTNKSFQSSPPPPPKRHCRSLSVPEDLSQCRSTWHPSASKVWTPVKRGCHSRGASSSGSGASSLLLCGPSSSFTSSSLHSSSSPNFFSLALSSDSSLSCGFPWDPCDTLKGACSASLATPSSCSSSPAPLVSHSILHRRFSLSPVHIQIASVASLHPPPSPAHVLAHSFSGPEHPSLCPSPTSACSTPSCSRRDLHPALPRCHSQPCDMRKPRLKRRHDPDVLPCSRPGLDFSKMTQMGNYESLVGGTGGGIFPVSSQSEQRLAFSPAEFLGRTSIGPLSESEEEEEEEEEECERTVLAVGKKFIFERDCTDLDLSLIEEN
ncbi:protein FAM53C-like [Xiphophorus maculatus]|uniref:Family with sequence similarity 53 member C n=1 Tax=Xiphophorus maculatus TaxID=8083 RepID=A0A3B5R9A0_XIPMA|nr:protein FAM53C-like [Xiphophorus maculatus]XP_023183913.1 protein FAM53C-like [Xiphophorus maculatus]